MKKLLVSGGAYGDIPVIKAAKALGFYVITTGNSPTEKGHQFSDEYIACDYSDKDALLNLAQTLQVDVICSSCSDISAVSSAYVAEKLSLPGHDNYETASIIHNKDRFRQFCLENDVPSPAARNFDQIEPALEVIPKTKFPAIVKPVDMTGGAGIVRADTPEELKIAINNAFMASKARRIVIEDFLAGTYHGCSTFIVNGKVVFSYLDDEYYYSNNKYRVGGTSTPSTVPKAAHDQLIYHIERIAHLLKLNDGIFHAQFILNDSQPYFMDVCRRLPGDLYPIIVQYATGIDYASYVVKLFSGADCSNLVQPSPSGYYGRANILSQKTGTMTEFTLSESLQNNLIEKHLWIQPGDYIDRISMPKFGIAYFEFFSAQEMAEKMSKMDKLMGIQVS